MSLTLRFRDLDRNVTERITTLERGSKYRSRKSPWPCPSLDNVEPLRTPKVVPHRIEVATKDQPEEWTDFWRGDEVTAPTRMSHCRVETVRPVQGDVHELTEWDRSASREYRGV
jgi:hypothetical protein